MTLDLSHLTAPIRELAFQDAKARIRLVQTARWVGYPRAGVAVEELERRFNYPTCARMPCMLLYGDSGMGKSMILEKMERQHPSSYDQRRGITKRPVVIVQMPSSRIRDDSIPGSSRFWEHPTPPTKNWACWRRASSIFCKRWGRSCCALRKCITCLQGVTANSVKRSIYGNSSPTSRKLWLSR